MLLPNEKNLAAEIALTPCNDRSTEEENSAGEPSHTSHSYDVPRGAWPVIVLDAVHMLVPLLLICKIPLCIAAVHIDRNSTGILIGNAHSITLYLIKFNSQLTTLFTLLFGTILADLVRRVALWRAQHGASVAEPEQWQASISVKDTVIDYISCLVLFVLAIARAYLRPRTHAPKIFGFVSSMITDNSHVTQTASTADLDGMEQAKVLKKVTVRFTDADDKPGHGRGPSLVQVDYPGRGPVQKLSRPKSRT